MIATFVTSSFLMDDWHFGSVLFFACCEAKFLPDFDLKNMISNLNKGFSMEKIAQIRQISKKKFLDRQNFMISSSR
jgi:hypothetical protein